MLTPFPASGNLSSQTVSRNLRKSIPKMTSFNSVAE